MEIALDYREQLNQNLAWALWEGGMFFEGTNKVHVSLQRITRKLGELDIPYAIVGGMALYLHGYRRFTDDVDLLVTPASLAIIHEKLVGLGYVSPFAGSKNLKDAETGVKIEFLVTGEYPGDGLPKPVRFPDPADVYESIEGIATLTLSALIELKLASGMAEWRQRDLVDIQALIGALQLSADFAEKLNPFVRPLYLERWRLAQLGN